MPASLWPPAALVAVYRLRWRIEIIFKTWKSYLGFRHLNCRTILGISVAQWLEFSLAHHAFYDQRKDRQNYYQPLAAVGTLA